jgi:hypothetical protein
MRMRKETDGGLDRFPNQSLHAAAIQALPGGGHPLSLCASGLPPRLAHFVAGEQHQVEGLRVAVGRLGSVVLDPERPAPLAGGRR